MPGGSGDAKLRAITYEGVVYGVGCGLDNAPTPAVLSVPMVRLGLLEDRPLDPLDRAVGGRTPCPDERLVGAEAADRVAEDPRADSLPLSVRTRSSRQPWARRSAATRRAKALVFWADGFSGVVASSAQT